MGKKKRIGKLERDNTICLLENGYIEMVHRTELLDYYKGHDVEFVLVPMDDGKQYCGCIGVPKKFKSFEIDFEVNLMAPEGVECFDIEDALYEKVSKYHVVCNDFVEFVRFIQSMWLMISINDNFDVGADNPMSAYQLEFTNVSYVFAKSKNHVECGRLRNLEGTILQTFSSERFIESVLKIVTGFHSLSAFLIEYNIIVIDTEINRWEFIDHCKTVDDLSDYDDNRYRIMEFSTFSFTAVPVSFTDMAMLFRTMTIMPVQVASIVDMSTYTHSVDLCGPSKNIYDVIMNYSGDVYQHALSMASFSTEPYADMFDVYYVASIPASTDVGVIIVALHDYRRIMMIVDMINKTIIGDSPIVIFQISSEIRSFADSDKTIYHYICGDNHTLSSIRDMYNEYMDELFEMMNGQLPYKYSLREPESLYEMPFEPPF